MSILSTASFRFGVVGPSYNWDQFEPEAFDKLVTGMSNKICELLKIHPEIEALAACGFSGLPIASALAYKLGMPLIAVRQKGVRSHDRRRVNGWVNCKGYLIIDDLIDSGATIDNIVEQIGVAWKEMTEANKWRFEAREWLSPEPPKPVAILLHTEHDNREVTVAWRDEPMTIRSYGYHRQIDDAPSASMALTTPDARQVKFYHEMEKDAKETKRVKLKVNKGPSAKQLAKAKKLADSIDFSGLKTPGDYLTDLDMALAFEQMAGSDRVLSMTKVPGVGTVVIDSITGPAGESTGPPS